MSFEPIAIVGRACLLPGAHSPRELLALAGEGRVLLRDAPPGRWRAPDDHVVADGIRDAADRTWTRRGGYVEGFEFEAGGYRLPSDELLALDPLVHWVIDTARRALRDADLLDADPAATGAVLGNLSLPSSGASRFAESVWMGSLAERLGLAGANRRDRFNSGAPAHLLAAALGLGRRAYALDAACASSLYAIEQACRCLQSGRADRMLAGAVNRADDLFLHVGFCALGAMSRSGQSRPFHAEADGLVPGDGCGFVVLERLDDAVRAGRTIHGVIRAVGLSNDGRGHGLLAPSESGQERAMALALGQAGLRGTDVPYVECHATGTPVGDACEIASMTRVYGHGGVRIGSLKGNLGHLITAAGVAGLIKVLESLREGVVLPTPAQDHRLPALEASPFETIDETMPWRGPRRAGLSAFGFGGNNAHLIVESHEPAARRVVVADSLETRAVVVVGIGARVGAGQSVADFERALLGGAPGRAETVRIPMGELRFPPDDLKKASGQQTQMLSAGLEATRGLKLPRDRTGVFVGYQCDPEICRWGARWRSRSWGQALGADEAWIDATRDAFVPPLEAQHVLGTLPNVPANRLSSQLDLMGPSMTTSAEELSGVRALQLAVEALQRGDLDAALVGAVDLSAEPVHAAAVGRAAAGRAAAVDASQDLGDAAIALVLRRREDAEAEGLPIYGEVSFAPNESEAFVSGLPRAHAAVGLVEIAGALLAVARDRRRHAGPFGAGDRALSVTVGSLWGPSVTVGVRASGKPMATLTEAADVPCLTLPAHLPPVELPALRLNRGVVAMQKMEPAPFLPPTSDDGPPSPPTRPATAIERSAPPPAAPVQTLTAASFDGTMAQAIAAHSMRMADLHRAFVQEQSLLHQRFLDTVLAPPGALTSPRHQVELRSSALVPSSGLVQPQVPSAAEQTGFAAPGIAPTGLTPPASSIAVAMPGMTRAPTMPAAATPPVAANGRAPSAPSAVPMAAAAPAPATTARLPAKSDGAHSPARPDLSRAIEQALPLAFRPTGPSFSREDLMVHAGGTISEIFGPLFVRQDGHDLQVRMPEPPLLLADRCTGIDAEPGSMKKGTCWTETDVRADSWYVHDGHMPAGIMVESGQADLFLISYLGADFLNCGQRAYRLLGCEMTWHGDLPQVGETLAYDIHIDGHAAQGDVRLFFFHYDCHIRRADGTTRPALSVRHGQAGFFTKEELAASDGILWKAADQEIRSDARVDPPTVPLEAQSYDRLAIEAFAAGRPWECFGDGFLRTKTHTRTPRIQDGTMLFLDTVEILDPRGGPWGRGYLKAVAPIAPDDWYFDGHFKNDPCMPGTLMLEGCVQAMAFYLSALGYTVDRDGWRFQPIADETYSLRCRGQVTPSSKTLTYELFIEEVQDGPTPRLYADLLCTVDGLGAFHARRFGLELTPSWPLTSRPDLVERGSGDDRAATASYQDGAPFRFDQPSLIACAWGQPSTAFGPMYARFDGHRRTPRLPGPPYHFLTRVTKVDGAIGGLESGKILEFEYDVPPDAWYFDDGGARIMPFAVLLEAALQPCGWSASYVGCTLTSDSDFLFRNLDGVGAVKAEVGPNSGTLRTVVKVKSISRSSGMIIVSFLVNCHVGSTEVYELDTVFGFFPPEAFVDQAGLPIEEAHRTAIDAPGNVTIDLRSHPAPYRTGTLRLAASKLLMIDRVTRFEPHGGAAGLGIVRAEKDVDAAEWFFKAHFYQDPVQPGSLGIEAMLQTLQFHMIEAGLGAGVPNARFEAIATGRTHAWKYRGQVVPEANRVTTTLEVVESGTDERGVYALADASLWVDGKRIYEARGLGMRIVAGDDPTEEVLDPDRDVWLRDHRPTYTLPALPMMSMVDRMMAAVARERGGATGLSELRVERWVVVDGPTRLKTEVAGDQVRLLVWRDAKDPRLSRFEIAAQATIVPPPSMEPLPPLGPTTSVSPYGEERLFHGPSFHYVRTLEVGAGGARALLDAAPRGVPFGTVHQGLLDAITHVIPQDRLHQWSPRVGADQVGYPHQLDIRFDGEAPRDGEVRCDVRFVGFRGDDARFPVFRGQLWVGDRLWVDLRLVEILLPKGPIGMADPVARRRFLERRPGGHRVGLSRQEGDRTVLEAGDVALSDWFPGTMRAVYGTAVPWQIAVKEHYANRLATHPSHIAIGNDVAIDAHAPLTLHPFRVEGEASICVRDAGAPRLDLAPVEAFWRKAFDIGPWPVEDLYYGLVERFVGAVRVEDPEAWSAISGRSVLYLGNHQTGIESLIFSIVASALQGVPTLTLAKVEHRQSWLGKLITHCFSWPGVEDPGVIAYFDRGDPQSLVDITKELASKTTAKSLMVHVEGTRAHSARHRVANMSGVFCDLAIGAGVPIVPIRFVGGLPVESAADKLEYPVGMGRQDYYVGRPLMPAELSALPYKERVGTVIAAINRLGPSAEEEQPQAGDRELAAAVDGRAARTGVGVGLATIVEVLRARPSRSEAVGRLLAAVDGPLGQGDDAESRWLNDLAGMLSGAAKPA